MIAISSRTAAKAQTTPSTTSCPYEEIKVPLASTTSMYTSPMDERTVWVILAHCLPRRFITAIKTPTATPPIEATTATASPKFTENWISSGGIA